MHAVVLRRRDSGESDRRLTVLTLEEGKIDVVAKGARKGGSRLAGSSEPLTAGVLQLALGKKNLFVTQAQPQSAFRGLRADYERLTLALALLELYDAVLPYEQPMPDAYALLIRSLVSIESHEKAIVAAVWAQLALMAQSGFLPSFGACAITGAPIAEAQALLSPRAGGYVAHAEAGRFTDRFAVPAEVLVGLTRTAELDQPPPNLKLARESYLALLPFWRHLADRPLPACEAAANELRG